MDILPLCNHYRVSVYKYENRHWAACCDLCRKWSGMYRTKKETMTALIDEASDVAVA